MASPGTASDVLQVAPVAFVQATACLSASGAAVGSPSLATVGASTKPNTGTVSSVPAIAILTGEPAYPLLPDTASLQTTGTL